MQINKEIIRLAIPNIISNISVPLLSVVDLMLMGQLEAESPIYIGAVVVGGTIFNVLYWGFIFLRMGTTGMTAQAYGQKDDKASAQVLAQAATVALAGAVLLILSQVFIEWLSLYLMAPTEEVIDYTKEYFRIRIWAAPATLGLYVLNGWFLGMQNARYPMIITILVNLLNVVLNIALVNGMGMKSDGVAYGTLMAQYGGLTLALSLLVYSYRPILQEISTKLITEGAALVRFFNVNRDIFIRSICLNLVFAYFTAKSAQVDALILAANGILIQYLMIFSYAVDGFAYAAESIIGRYFGAKDMSKLKVSIQYLFYWSFAFASGFAILYGLGGEWLLSLFTSDQAVIDTAMKYVYWLVVLAIPAAAAYIWDGIYVGATASKAMRNTMLLASVIFFFPVYLLLESSIGNHALWLALVTFMLARAFSMWYLAKRYIYID